MPRPLTTRRGYREVGTPPKQPAKSYALWLVSRRDYSAAELQQRLSRKGYPAQEIEEALAYLQSYQFQDDERCARNTTQAKAHKMGDRQLKSHLAAKGLAKDLVEAQLSELPAEELRVLDALSRFRGKPVTDELKTKIWRFLAYRGFGSSAIKAAVQHLQEEALERESAD